MPCALGCGRDGLLRFSSFRGRLLANRAPARGTANCGALADLRALRLDPVLGRRQAESPPEGSNEMAAVRDAQTGENLF